MTEQLVCRAASLDDWAFVESMERDQAIPSWLLRQKVENGDVLVAEEDGELVGYLRLDYLYSVVPYLSLVVVAEERRGRGIGRSILAFGESRLREAGHTLLLSTCELDGPEPQEWHRKMGFRDCGVLFGVSPGRYGDLFLRKDLQASGS